ncbi:MAG: response regulator [Chitinophagaceae bacterium]
MNYFLNFSWRSISLFLQEVFNPHSNWNGELTCVRINGTRFPGSISFVSFMYNNKWYKKITISDITEKNNILAELRVAKMKAEESANSKSQFLSHMSHELRTPLNGIIGSTNLLLQSEFLAEQKEQLSVLKFTSEHMMNLINDILDLSKLDADRIQLERTEVNIGEFVNKISLPFVSQFENKGIALRVIIDKKVRLPLLADPTRLNQVLTNLLSNAFKFTDRGSVTLEVKGISLRSDYNTIEFSVADTGIGISVDKQEQIFEQFKQADIKTTRKYGGTGLGLTISQKLVGIMGGELKVESKNNEGSRFYFQITLPVHHDRKNISISEPVSLADDQNLNSIKVLVAEDNPINMMIVSKFLEKWGVTYEKAKNGLEAVFLFQKSTFDVVLMDLEMPEMDGYEALSEIRKLNPDVPAVAFTAAIFDNMKEDLIKKGFDDYLQKPFRPEDLQAKLVTYSVRKLKRA